MVVKKAKKQKLRPPRVYRNKRGKPYIIQKGKKYYLNFGKKTNDMSTLQIVKLFMKYLGRPKTRRAPKRQREDLRNVQSLSEIEQNTRTAINDHLDKLRKEKYEKIDEIDQKEKKALADMEEEKKRQERKDIADAKERQEALDREHKRELAEIKERQEQKDRELRREQKLIEDLQYKQQRNQRLAIMPPPQQQYITVPQAPQFGNIPPPPPLPSFIQTNETKEEEPENKDPQLEEDKKLMKDALFTDDEIKKMRKATIHKLANGIRMFRDQNVKMSDMKKALEQAEKAGEAQSNMNDDMSFTLKMNNALSKKYLPEIKISDLSHALRKKLENDGHTKLNHRETIEWIMSMVKRFNIDVGTDEKQIKKKIADYADYDNWMAINKPTEQKGDGAKTLDEMIAKVFSIAKKKI